ncbi:MAG: hypothetical protein HYY61_05715, partial [Deltaproteobacteria bacterium]|nr:hypothetical protein [Deltaproteobacteria bacterium]
MSFFLGHWKRASLTLSVSTQPFLERGEGSSHLTTKEKERLIKIQNKLTYNYHQELLQNPLLLQKTTERLRSKDPSNNLAASPAKGLKIKVEEIAGNQALFHLSVKHKEPVLFLNTLIAVYLEDYFESQIKEKEKLMAEINKKLTALENTIIDQEAALLNTKTS